MKILSYQNTALAISEAASRVLHYLDSDNSYNIGLATGKTMVPLYREITEQCICRKIKINHHYFFLLDEYLGISSQDSSSFVYFVLNHFFKPLQKTGLLDHSFIESHFFYPDAFDPIKGPRMYEQKIFDRGGIDLQILGLGMNGHIGFNEPGSSKNSRTRVISLKKETIEQNFVGRKKKHHPTKAITLGVENILESKEILMIVTGLKKADVVKYLIDHDNDPACPATYLKNHVAYHLILDEEASSKINFNC